MCAALADLAQRLKQAIEAAKLSPQLLAEYSVHFSQHEDQVLKAFGELEELTNTPDVEAFVKALLKGNPPRVRTTISCTDASTTVKPTCSWLH